MENWREAGFGLYLHWPFCAAKCPYCDFNSHVVDNIDIDRWSAAYLSEIARLGAALGDRVLGSVFIGGGTPSMMPPRLVETLLEAVVRHWRVANALEVTMEANPTSSDARKFRDFAAAGVTRLSVGLQAIDDNALRNLGRLHDAREGLAAYEAACRAVERVSFDLIYARQDQTLCAWQEELAQALALEPSHLSLYQLTIEEGTVFHERLKRGRLRGLPGEDLSVALYEQTLAACAEAGLRNYEISNFAREGAESQHNLVYWRGGDYGGIGPGAHGRLTFDGQRWATRSAMMPGEWLRRVEESGDGDDIREALGEGEAAEEYLLMGLRLSEGIDQTRYRRLGGSGLQPEIVDTLVTDDLCWKKDGRVGLTGKGRMLMDSLLPHLS
ncbi:MAG: coproporphyrinogen III oxidase [Rhodobacteraceae bacterium]|nr:MAG: coproporphyrinogen III oxidase [Paracoccaceae bacterium]